MKTNRIVNQQARNTVMYTSDNFNKYPVTEAILSAMVDEDLGLSAWRQMHPMSGGMCRVKSDSDQEKLSLRDRRFGVYLAPLPQSLKLPKVDRKPQLPAKKAAERQPIVVSV